MKRMFKVKETKIPNEIEFTKKHMIKKLLCITHSLLIIESLDN